MADGPEPFSIILSTRGEPLARGAAPPVSVLVRNVSAQPAWIIGIIDGSVSGARFPKWIPQVIGPNGPFPPTETPDFTSPLRPSDFRRLNPGEAFDPTAPANEAVYFRIPAFDRITEEPGEYVATLELDASSLDASSWLGTLPDRRPQAEAERAEVLRRLELVPRVHLRSNTIVLRIA